VAAGPPQTSASGLLRPTLGEDRLLQKHDDAYSDRLLIVHAVHERLGGLRSGLAGARRASDRAGSRRGCGRPPVAGRQCGRARRSDATASRRGAL